MSLQIELSKLKKRPDKAMESNACTKFDVQMQMQMLSMHESLKKSNVRYHFQNPLRFWDHHLLRASLA